MMKKILIYIVLVCVCCSKPVKESSEVNSDITIEPMEKVKVSNETNPTQELNLISNSYYYFGPYLNKETCQVLAECDCCSSEIYFKYDSVFVAEIPCEGESIYLRGIYEQNSNRIILKYDSLYVVNVSTFGDYREEGVQYGTFKKYGQFETDSLLITDCSDKIIINWKEQDELLYGQTNSKFGRLQYVLNSDQLEISNLLEL